MPIDLYPNIAKVKRNGAYQNLPGFVQQSTNADIEAMIANKETSTTAQYAHPKNSFFILNDILYQADANISINDTIAVGTNCHVSALGNDVGNLITNYDKLSPIASHFFYPTSIPSINRQDRTLTFYKNCPFFAFGKSYGHAKTSNTVINIPEGPISGTNYLILYLDCENSDHANLSFVILPYSVIPNKNYAYVGQMNVQDFIFSFPFNYKIDDIPNYASGKIENSLTVDCYYTTYSGGYIQAANGNIGSNANTGYTSFIDVSGFNTIICPVDYSQTYQMAFYDKNKTYVSGAQKTGTAPYLWVIPVPANATYARLSFYLSVENTFYAKGIIGNIEKFEKRENKLKGKKLGIIGDSISTYSGFLPSGYQTYYPRYTVTDPEKTWWKQLLNETEMELCVNASWSGSTICGDTTNNTGVVGCSDARVNALTDGQGNKPDVIIVYMGINDFGKSNGITCGTYDGKAEPSTATNITSITEAFGVLLKKLENTYPNARIFVCRIMPEKFSSEMSASYANGFPDINPDDNVTLPQLNDYIEKIADAFGCGIIPMDKCGATFFNINTYTGDGLHPNALLTPKMCEVAKETILNIMD